MNCRHNAYFLGEQMQAYALLLEGSLGKVSTFFFIGVEIAYLLLKENRLAKNIKPFELSLFFTQKRNLIRMD